jgi:hypothetical protein
LRFLDGRGPDSKPNDAPVSTQRERSLIGKILIERDDHCVTLLGPCKDFLIYLSGQLYFGGMMHNPRWLESPQPWTDRTRDVLVEKDDKGIRHAE